MNLAHAALAARRREGGSGRPPNVIALTVLLVPIAIGLLITVRSDQPAPAIIGLVLGVVAHRPAAGAIAGALIGAGGAAGFYLLAPLAGYAAMFLMWIAIWVALGVLGGWLRTRTLDLRGGLARGGVAAVASGAAFYAISGIWRPFDPHGWDYATHFGAWTLAYLPGFAALLVGRRDAAGRN